MPSGSWIYEKTNTTGSGAGGGPTAVPPPPLFSVQQDPADQSAIEIYSLHFATPSDPLIATILSGLFGFFYVDPDSVGYSLTAAVTNTATSISLSAPPTNIANGDYIQIGPEIMLAGTPSGSTVPVTRGQLTSAAVAHSAGNAVWRLTRRVVTVSFPNNFFVAPLSASALAWTYTLPLPGALVACVTGAVANSLGSSTITTDLLTALPGNGIQLTAASSLDYNAAELVGITASPQFGLLSNATAFTFKGKINVADTDPAWPNTALISIVATGPAGSGAPSGAEIARMAAPFTVAAGQVDYVGELVMFLQSATDEVWSVTATPYDHLGHPGHSPVTASSITVGKAAVVGPLDLIELAPRFQDPNGSVRTKAQATVRTANNQAPMIVAIWLMRDGTNWLRQGWFKIAGSPQVLVLPAPDNDPLGYYAPTVANESWIIAAITGAIPDSTPPAGSIMSTALSMVKTGKPAANGVTAASAANPITITDGLGAPDWRIPLVNWTDPNISTPAAANYDINAFLTVLTFQCTDASGNRAPGSEAGNNDQGGDEVEVWRAQVLGEKVQQTTGIDSYGFNPAGSVYTYAYLRIYTLNRSATGFKDAANATLQTTCWSGATDHALKNFGPFPGASLTDTAAFAPNLSAAAIKDAPSGILVANNVEAVPNYVTVGGMPKWNFNWSVTFPNAAAKTTIRSINLTSNFIGVVQTIPSSQFGTTDFPYSGTGGLTMTGITQNFDRDDLTHPAYTVQFWVENSDGVLTASPPAALVRPAGTSAPFVIGALQLPPQILTVGSITPSYIPYGHLYKMGFQGISWTVPANPNNVAYNVRVIKISPSALGSRQSTIDTIAGPFTKGPVEGGTNTVNPPGFVMPAFASSEVDAGPLVAGNWVIRLIPFNADNFAGASTDISVAVAPNVITPGSLVAYENTAGRYTQPGGAAYTQLAITAVMTSVNAPGLAIGNGQVRTDYFSRDGGATWIWFGWFQQKPGTGPGIDGTFWDIDRPTASDQTHCKVACAIGAFDAIANGSPFSALPANAVVSVEFTFSRVGAPSAGSITGFSINPITASGSAVWPTTSSVHKVVIAASGAATTFGLPDGIQWVNPPRSGAGSDPNFFYAALTFQVYSSNQTDKAPPHPSSPGGTGTDQGGLEVIVHQWSDPGLVNFTDIEGWTFNPAGSTYTFGLFRLYAVSRSANGWQDGTTQLQNGQNTPNGRTLVTQGWIEFGPPPPATTISDTEDIANLRVRTSFLADCGVATELGLMTRSLNATPALNPGITFGALTHKNGSVWSYYNPQLSTSGSPVWATVDFAAIGGGVTLLNSMSGPISIVNGTGIGVSSGGGTITITNTGVTQLVAGSNVTLSPTSGLGVVTISASAGAAGVSSVTAVGAGIFVSPTIGAVQIQNTGVTSLIQGANITLSASTGAITISATGGGGGTNVAPTFEAQSAVWNAIKTTGISGSLYGGMASIGSVQAGNLFTIDWSSIQNKWLFHGIDAGNVSVVIDAWDNNRSVFAVPVVLGRRLSGTCPTLANGSNGIYNSLQTGDVLFAMGGRGTFRNAAGTFGGITSANSAVISFSASETWTDVGQGADIVFATTPNGSTPTITRPTRMTVFNSGLVEIVTAFNLKCGLATDLGIVMKQAISAPGLTPPGVYGGIAYQAGANYWFWNGSAWFSGNTSNLSPNPSFTNVSVGAPSVVGGYKWVAPDTGTSYSGLFMDVVWPAAAAMYSENPANGVLTFVGNNQRLIFRAGILVSYAAS